MEIIDRQTPPGSCITEGGWWKTAAGLHARDILFAIDLSKLGGRYSALT